MTYSIKSLLVFLMFFAACNTSKTTLNTETKENTMANAQTDKTMMDDGYTVGTIKYMEKSDCPYIIVDETTNAQLDPINFEDAKFSAFKKNDEKVYFKYRPLRRMNRCNEASPIELQDIKKRTY